MKRMLFGLIMLTGIHGEPIPVDSHQVSIINLHGEHCGKAGGTVIMISVTKLCVRESRDEIRRKKSDCELRNICDGDL